MLTPAQGLTPANEELNKLLQEMCSTQPEALRWLSQAIEVAMLYDHIIDDDGFTKDEVHKIMHYLLVEWAMNNWYLRNAPALGIVAMNALSAWKHSNKDGAHKIKSYDALTEIQCTVAFLIGGHAHVEKYIPRIRELTDILFQEDEKEDHGKK